MWQIGTGGAYAESEPVQSHCTWQLQAAAFFQVTADDDLVKDGSSRVAIMLSPVRELCPSLAPSAIRCGTTAAAQCAPPGAWRLVGPYVQAGRVDCFACSAFSCPLGFTVRLQLIVCPLLLVLCVIQPKPRCSTYSTHPCLFSDLFHAHSHVPSKILSTDSRYCDTHKYLQRKRRCSPCKKQWLA